MATPQVPPRPARSHHAHGFPAGSSNTMPPIPPRPAGRRTERSQSPSRYAPSPLNELPLRPPSAGGPYGSGRHNASNSSLDLPQRPPSVTLPSIGQEGNEYADLDLAPTGSALEKSVSAPQTQTSHVGSDLPLHAPKPSLSKSDAKARISAVTRTDSARAAAHGLGHVVSPDHADDADPHHRPLKSRASATFAPRSTSSLSTERPGSAAQLDEAGIPHIGQHVPMLPNAGDVQAPSPGPGAQFPPGIGFHNDGSRSRQHGRPKSAREVFPTPPGSYGLHGHGVADADRFEKAWYEKHPEDLKKEEQGLYSPAIAVERPEWALTSDDLNKIVRETAKGSGPGTQSNIVGLPDEQIGYIASEQYAARIGSPGVTSPGYQNKAHSNTSQSHITSPLRKASFPVGETDPLEKTGSTDTRKASENATEESGAEDEVIHIDAPEEHWNKFTTRNESHEDLGPRGGNTDAEGGYVEERGYGTPILASDEITPGTEFLQPAISPAFPSDRRGSGQDDFNHLHRYASHGLGSASSSRPGSRPGSRPASRPGSIHGMPLLTKFISHDDEGMHTPLEDVDEYEPLFTDDDSKPTRPQNKADRLKMRPDVRRRFPSQDIWEDTPTSLQLQTEVQTPEPEERQEPRPDDVSAVSRKPDEEAVDTTEQEEASDHAQNSQFHPSHQFGAHLKAESGRPNAQRFPSRDIWEDTPDSQRLETTVNQSEEAEPSPPDNASQGQGKAVNGASMGQPSIPPRPSKSKLTGKTAEAAAPAQPQVPPRPQKSKDVVTGSASSDMKELSPTDIRRVPSMSDKPKPQIPARPKPATRGSQEAGAQLTKTLSAGSDGNNDSAAVKSPPVPSKPKPMVPARPAGSKIASLQAGFMSDLNNRLKIGPQVPAKPQEQAEEAPEEKAPLVDARKGRARGPARRKPGVSPAAAAAAPPAEVNRPTVPQFSMATPWHVWSIKGNGNISVGHKAIEERAAPSVVAPVNVNEPAEAVLANKSSEAREGISERIAKPETLKAEADTNVETTAEDIAEEKTHIGPPATQIAEEPATTTIPPASSALAAEEETHESFIEPQAATAQEPQLLTAKTIMLDSSLGSASAGGEEAVGISEHLLAEETPAVPGIEEKVTSTED